MATGVYDKEDLEKGIDKKPDKTTEKTDDSDTSSSGGEAGFSYNPDSQTSTEQQGLEKSSPTARNLYRNKIDTPTGTGRFKKYAGMRRRWILGGLGVSLIGGLFSLFVSFLPLELLHIAEVFQTEIGGIQDTVLTTRSGKIYSRMFFFRDDGVFDGYKERGSIFSFVKNRTSQNLLEDMRSKGFEIDPDIDETGRWTGRFNSISWDGADEIIDTDAKFQSFWEQRSNLRTFFKEKYPSKSWFWRTRKAWKMYPRFGLSVTRGDWLRNNKVARAIDDVTLRVRKLARDAQIGSDNITSVRGRNVTGEDTDGNDVVDQDAFDDVQDAADDARAKYDNPEISVKANDLEIDVNKTVKEIAEEVPEIAVTGTAKGLLRGINVFNTVDSACEVKRVLLAIELGSRVLKAVQLMKYAGIFLSVANTIKAGEAGNDEVSTFTNWVNTPDKETGRDFFGSGAWAWAAGIGGGAAVVSAKNATNYSVGGGWTGTLAEINDGLDRVPGVNPTSCKFTNNFGVQILGGGIGIVIGIFSGGSISAVQLGLGVAAQIIIEVLKAIATPILVDMVAGTVIDYFETGDEMAAALVSGYNVMNGAQGGNHGMRPVDLQTYAYLQGELDKDLRQERSQTSFFARLFDTGDYNSLASRTAYALPRSFTTTGHQIKNSLSDPLSTIASMFQLPFNNNKAFARISSSEQCNDDDIVAAGLAADPFCNVIFGESADILDRDPQENLLFMVDRDGDGVVGEDGGEAGGDGDYANGDGFPLDGQNGRAETRQGLAFREYLNQCNSGETSEPLTDTSIIDVLHNYDEAAANNEFIDMCYTNSYNFGDLGTHDTWRFRLFVMDNAIIDAIEEDIEQDFQGNSTEIVRGNVTIPGELELPPNFDPTPTAEGYYRMPDSVTAQEVGIDASGDLYVWNGGTPENSRCGSQTLIAAVYTVAKRWKTENPNSTIIVGDLNEEAGHVSHNYGVDVDITVQGTPDAANTSQDPTAAGSIRLAQMFADTGIIEVIGYRDNRVISAYDEYADLFGLPGYVGYWDGHADHFHVRILQEYRDEDGDGEEERSAGCDDGIDNPALLTSPENENFLSPAVAVLSGRKS